MKAALREAGRTPADVGHINAHWMSKKEGEVHEARKLKKVCWLQVRGMNMDKSLGIQRSHLMIVKKLSKELK